MQASADRDTALHRTLVGEDHVWGLPEQLAAATVDAINRGNWQRSGGKGRKPKPIPRPGVKKSAKPRKVGGTTSMPLAQAQAMFERHNPSAFTRPQEPAAEGRSASAEQTALPVETPPQ